MLISTSEKCELSHLKVTADGRTVLDLVCALTANFDACNCAHMQGRTILDLVCALRATFALGDDPQAAGQEDPYAMQWRDLIGSVDHMFKVVPQVNCMLGPLDAQPKGGGECIQNVRDAGKGPVVLNWWCGPPCMMHM
eukprot:scaffold53424_cov25-Tisochrysis_lutea.AAC.2